MWRFETDSFHHLGLQFISITNFTEGCESSDDLEKVCSIRFLSSNENIPKTIWFLLKVVLYSGFDNTIYKKIAGICHLKSTTQAFEFGNRLMVFLRIFESFDAKFSALIYPSESNSCNFPSQNTQLIIYFLSFSVCGGNVTSPNGILSPYFPNVTQFTTYRGINNPYTCEWVVKVRSSRTIQLNFLEMNITNDISDECTNYIMVILW